MKAYVFTDQALERFAGQFVWLSVDTEKAQNAWFREKFQLEGLPSFYIVNPRDETVALRWLGSATVPQLTTLFEHGTSAVAGGGSDLQQKLARADKLYADRKNQEAAAAYEEALKVAPANWSGYGRTNESLVFALLMSKQYAKCVNTSLQVYPKVRNSPSAITVAALGVDCAVNLPKEQADRASLISALEKNAREALSNPKVKVAADDRSGTYITLIGAREDAGDEAGARKLGEEWASFLEAEAAKAPNPDARAVFDSHRLSAYLNLKQPEKAVEMLTASERDLPNDYNPPARLASAYRAMKRYDDALAASDRALARVYGPRKLLVLQTRADIYKDMGDKARAKATLEQALQTADSLPPAQRNDSVVSTIRKKLAEL